MTDAPPTATADRGPEWAELAALLRQTAAMFGSPGEIAEERAAPLTVVRAISLWLGALEAMARALLVRLALGLPRPVPARRRALDATRGTRGREPLAGGDALLESERWTGVWFAGVPRASCEHGEGRGRTVADEAAPGLTGGAPRLAWTAPLARRFEALIRVAEAPERYAGRIARRLLKDMNDAWRILRPPPEAGPAVHEREAVARAQAQAWLALEGFRNDTG